MDAQSGFLDYYHQALKDWVASADLPPEIREQYRFESLLKQGAGRELFFVTRLLDGQRAVLRTSREGEMQALTHEAALLARLQHPAIPRLLGIWKHKGRGFLVREYFEGEDLFAHVQKHGPLALSEVCDLAIKLCDLLIYLGRQQPPVIHRDIKPENIILTATGEVKLVDFDIARTYREGATTDTQVIGTKPYMAPEQFGSEQSDSRADIYALGMVMVFLATGKTDKTRLAESFPYKALLPILHTCLRKDRDQRFQSAQQLKRRLLWLRRGMTRRLLLGAGILALMAACLVLGLSLGHGQGYQAGVRSILDVPQENMRPFSQQQLDQTLQFDSEYLDLAVRNILNKEQGQPIYRRELASRINSLIIYGTFIQHPDLHDSLIKTQVDRGQVAYRTASGFAINARGDLGSLADIPNFYYLRSLALTSQHISDLSPLSGMKLSLLNLSDNFVGNLLPLKDMVSLTQLDLSQNPFFDLRPLARLLSLKALDLGQTQVKDVQPLADLAQLERLSLCYCPVTDISVLANLPSLLEVDLRHTQVKDLRPLLREEKPIKVYAAGLAPEVLATVQGQPGILLITSEEPEKDK